MAGTKSSLEPDAAAEALVLNIDINDENWPHTRHLERYIRYKIYDPEKAARIMRLSEQIPSYDGILLREVEFKARLHLPDGTVRNFGAESVHERDMVKQGTTGTTDSFWRRLLTNEGWIVKEKFLAVGGAVPGSILEYSVIVDEHRNERTMFHVLQFDSIPVRQVTYRQKLPFDKTFWVHALYGLNTAHLEVSADASGQTLTAKARDLGSLSDEPFSGPLTDRAVTLADCYILRTLTTYKETRHETRKFTADEPWAPIATLEYWWASDHIDPTVKVTKTAAELTQGAGSDLEKARRIHDFVQRLHQQFIHAPASTAPASGRPVKMDDVLDLAKAHPTQLGNMDFVWLAISLFRAAGLQAEQLMLPDRGMVLFSRKLVSPAFLPTRCVAIHVGDAWHFSMPDQKNPLAFDELPWQAEGLGGLLALDQKQEFIDVPFSAAEKSAVRRTGDFHLDASGTLMGEGAVVYGGHEGQIFRAKLAGQTKEARFATLQHDLTGEFEGAEVEVTDLRQMDDVYEPLEVRFKLNWPGFGVVTDQRMIFRAFVFRSNSRPPFASTERRNALVFPFRHRELDLYTIALPAGYEPEAKEAPPSYPGPTLSYQIDLGLDRKRMVLHVSRDFSAGVILASPQNYPSIKNWFDAVTLSDQHSLVLVQTPGEAQPAKSATVP
ncbi:transglutaminase-like domain-containing protein [Opitutus sp. GAS368]|uniref:transglutaminase-like domain-containing protein n=1 Tax=Opitutus sp. GAS368 TaxID=1882749 RepID=UPI0012FD2617|nr:transglutaminase-like domain-containing protein [Opitutus sp. GAS368]